VRHDRTRRHDIHGACILSRSDFLYIDFSYDEVAEKLVTSCSKCPCKRTTLARIDPTRLEFTKPTLVKKSGIDGLDLDRYVGMMNGFDVVLSNSGNAL
jgi:hypothetical protein